MHPHNPLSGITSHPTDQKKPPVPSPPRSGSRRRAGLLFSAGAFLFFILACGSFAPRPTPQTFLNPTLIPTRRSTATPTRPLPLTPTPFNNPVSANDPTPTSSIPSPTPTPAGNVRVGQAARVVARTGLNIRSEPSTQAELSGRFAPGAVVKVVGGPTFAEGYVWWQVDDGYGLAGWVAGGDEQSLWLDGDIGKPRPVNRPVRLGDIVTVSVAPGRVLTIRFEPGKKGTVNRRVRAGVLLDVVQGPVIMDGLRWWRLRHENGWEGWAAEGDAETRWLTPLE